MSLNDNLKAARLAAGKTQEQVANEAGMHITQYNGYERGRSRPAPTTLAKLADALATTVDKLEAEKGPVDEALPLSRTSSFAQMKADLAAFVAETLGVSAQQVVIKVEVQ